MVNGFPPSRRGLSMLSAPCVLPLCVFLRVGKGSHAWPGLIERKHRLIVYSSYRLIVLSSYRLIVLSSYRLIVLQP